MLYHVSLALLRIERVWEAVRNLDRSLEERLRFQELIGSVTDVESEDKIHIKSRSVTFSWQRGIKIGKSWLLTLSLFISIRHLLYHSNVSGTLRCFVMESVVITLYTYSLYSFLGKGHPIFVPSSYGQSGSEMQFPGLQRQLEN